MRFILKLSNAVIFLITRRDVATKIFFQSIIKIISILRLKCPKNKLSLRISLSLGKPYVYYVKAHSNNTIPTLRNGVKYVQN